MDPSVSPNPTPSDAASDRPSSTLPPLGSSLAIAVTVAAAGIIGWIERLSKYRPQEGWFALGLGLAGLYACVRLLPGLRERRLLRLARQEARRLTKAVEKALARAAVAGEKKQELQARILEVRALAQGTDLAGLEWAVEKLDQRAESWLPRKGARRETIEQVGGAILVALSVRAFFYEAYRIPSSSMLPTLLVGDHLFINKFVYGLRIPFTVSKLGTRVPARGDIVVFNRPGDEHGDDIIKRVIGLPGDVVAVTDRHVMINGVPLETRPVEVLLLDDNGDPPLPGVPAEVIPFAPFEEQVGEHTHVALQIPGYPQSSAIGNQGTWTVRDGHVFVMGDNRDNSQDSRFGPDRGGFGQVPVDYIKGRADILWLSIGGPYGVRFERFGKLIH